MPAPNGCLCPWANPVSGAPGWKVITSPRQLAVAVATVYRGTACRHEERTWQARIPQASLSVLAVAADAGMLRSGSAPRRNSASSAWRSRHRLRSRWRNCRYRASCQCGTFG